jgi:hypothetical protein
MLSQSLPTGLNPRVVYEKVWFVRLLVPALSFPECLQADCYPKPWMSASWAIAVSERAVDRSEGESVKGQTDGTF